jgi:hypothetical protein
MADSWMKLVKLYSVLCIGYTCNVHARFPKQPRGLVHCSYTECTNNARRQPFSPLRYSSNYIHASNSIDNGSSPFFPSPLNGMTYGNPEVFQRSQYCCWSDDFSLMTKTVASLPKAERRAYRSTVYNETIGGVWRAHEASP